MKESLPHYSLCTRFYSQLLPPELFYSPLGIGVLDAEAHSDLREAALYTGLQKVELLPVSRFNSTDYHITLFQEKYDTTVSGQVQRIPKESRYVLGYGQGNNRHLVFESVVMSREPSQDNDPPFYRIEELVQTENGYTGIALETDLSGNPFSLRYSRYWDDKTEMFRISTAGHKRNIAVNKYFNRDRKPPYSFSQHRSLQINYFPDSQKCMLITENSSLLENHMTEEDLLDLTMESTFNVDDPSSSFFGTNNVALQNGTVFVRGDSHTWEIPLSAVVFDNSTALPENAGMEQIVIHTHELLELNRKRLLIKPESVTYFSSLS